MAVMGDHAHEHKVNNNTLICNDIIEQILAHTQVKSLLRFKAVCKSWSSLISSRQFVDTHLSVCRYHNGSRIHFSAFGCCYRVVERVIRVECISGNNKPPWCFSFPRQLIDGGANCSDIQLVEISTNPFYNYLCSLVIAGSCNGLLFLIAHEGVTFLWNPSIREHIHLPPTIRPIHPYKGCSVINGLGYDSVSDEYKAVVFRHACRHHCVLARVSQLLVYNSRAGCWREVDDSDVPYCLCETSRLGVVVNGNPHWIVRDLYTDVPRYKPIIMYFDTVDDKLKNLPTPSRWCDSFDPYNLSVLTGRCVCATGKNIGESSVSTDGWVMNEYGVGDSWTKLFAIPESVISSESSIVPLGFMNHGDDLILEVNEVKIVTYNLERKEKKLVIGTTKLSAMLDPSNDGFKSVEYETSLVSPCSFRF